MRVAALYDIHGNLPALEAVLKEVRKSDVDQIVVGGDVVLGPMSRECLDMLLQFPLPVQFIQGNCEVSILELLTGRLNTPLPDSVLEDIRWTANSLLPQHQTIIAKWPKTITITIDELGEVLFCHATPRNENEIFTRLTPEEELRPIFEKLTASVVVCGHTHMQFDRVIGNVRVVNAGSVGMPFGTPGAYWLLLDQDIELRYTAYNTANAADEILKTHYPHAKDFAEKYVLRPPTEIEMLEVFNHQRPRS